MQVLAPEPDPPEAVMPLARKLVGFAGEQQRALELGAHEQYSWAGLRRNDVTERLSRLLAASVTVTPEQAAELDALRAEMLAIDRLMEQQLRRELEQARKRQRVFSRTRKVLSSSYLNAGPRPSMLDQQR
jgi:hypothetical protein